MRLLVSVRNIEEALLAAAGGADFIDLKEPGQGALGGLPTETIRAVVAALRERGIALPISATIGDLPMGDLGAILARVEAVGACGVDYVKVGIEREPGAGAVLFALANCGRPVVPVFIADRGLDQHAVARARTLGFPALMLDTAEKRAGSLFDALGIEVLQGFVFATRKAGVLVGLAGALRAAHADALAELAPDFAGFRSAVCRGERSDALDVQCLQELVVTMRFARAPVTRR
jgi:uncharacterized protein (UPF0264 family)